MGQGMNKDDIRKQISIVRKDLHNLDCMINENNFICSQCDEKPMCYGHTMEECPNKHLGMKGFPICAEKAMRDISGINKDFLGPVDNAPYGSLSKLRENK